MRPRPEVIPALILILVLLVLLAPIKTQFSYFDEGFVVFNATRVMGGDVPYRDFWEIYPPGQFYLLALVFKTFGATLLVARVYDTVVRFVVVLGLYLIVKRTTARAPALLGCIVTAILLASARAYVYPVFPALALGLLSILSACQVADTGRRGWLVLAGTLIGITTLFRWDIGLYAGVGVAATIIPFRYPGVAPRATNRINALSATFGVLAMVFGAAILIVLPCYGYWALKSGFSNLWTQVVIFPTTTLHDVRWRPYPPIIPSVFPSAMSVSEFKSAFSRLVDWLRFYFPLAAYGIVVCYYAFSIVRKRITLDAKLFATIMLMIFGALLFAQALSRYDYLHVVPSSVIAFGLVIPLAHRIFPGMRNPVVKRACLLILAGLAFVYFLLPIKFLLSSIKNFSPLGCHSHVASASCVYLNSDQEQAVDYVRSHTSDDESIFVGNRRHDRIFVNDVGFYFLAARPGATKYHELFPGVATTLPVQETIVREIESKNVNLIVLVNVPDSEEQNAGENGSGALFLDDFIRANYSQVTEFGNYAIWEKERTR